MRNPRAEIAGGRGCGFTHESEGHCGFTHDSEGSHSDAPVPSMG